MRKRIFSILTALCLCLTLLPGAAWAENGDTTEELPVCTCETACTAENMNASCSVCSVGGALPELCMKDTEPADVPLTQSEGKPMVLNGEGEMPREVETAVDLTAAIADSTVSIVKLAENIVIQSTLTVARIVTLDLNGHVLAYENSQDRGSVFVVEGGGHLTIQDSNPDALHRFTPNSDGLWVLDEENGTETVSGGVITGGTGYRISLGNSSVHYDAYYGGAVYIANGQLTMTGGNMIGCSAKDGGGGVCIDPSDGQPCRFSMTGGSIAGCVASGNGSGGGVYARTAGAVFDMSGTAAIHDCRCDGRGGGVHAYGTFQMSGRAVIRGCTVESATRAVHGGGVYVSSSSSFEMSDQATIENCQAISNSSDPSNGGGVHVANSASLTLSGSAVIQNCMAQNSVDPSETYGGGVSTAYVGQITLKDSARIANCNAENGSGLYITGVQNNPDHGKLIADGGSVDGDVVLGNGQYPCTITGSGGTKFSGKVTVAPGSTIKNGTFNGEVINNGTITGGTFTGGITGNPALATGSGTAEDPYQISTAAGLKWFRDKVNDAKTEEETKICAELTKDIDLENEAWTPIGNASDYFNTAKAYSGIFDGKGHTISGLNVTGNFEFAGLFGLISGATIQDLSISGLMSGSYHHFGSIAGTAAENSTIKNCSSHCNVTNTISGGYIGGVVGVVFPTATIIDCYNTGSINWDDSITHNNRITGGIAGRNAGTICNCYNVGSVSCNNQKWLGSIAGDNIYTSYSKGTVKNCYYLNTTSNKDVGGGNGIVTNIYPKSAEEFADGTVLALLKAGERGNNADPWADACQYVDAAGLTLPVFKNQNTHTHDLKHVAAKGATMSEEGNIEYWTCVCGKYFKDKDGTQEITQADTVIPKRHFSGSTSSYPITVPDKTENGSVSVSPKNASKGVTVTITVTPDSGYVLETISVIDKNGNDLKLTDEGNGKYTFTMPGSKVEVNVTFMEDNSVLNFFYDVPNDAYYYEAVKWAAENGITGGVGNSLFAPNQPCTRAQIVTFLWRVAGSPVVNYLMPFTDVDESAYYAEAVRWAASTGIVTGLTETTFGANDVCTRAQAAAMIYRYAQAQGKGFTGAWMFLLPFTDVPEWAYESVAWCYMNGVTTGVSETVFAPSNDCTRAQIVTFLWRAFSK